MPLPEEDWLYGWDPTPGIVSVWAEMDGRAVVWRRVVQTRELLREEVRFRPWLLAPSLLDLRHLGARLVPHDDSLPPAVFSYQELEGASGLRYLVRGPDTRQLRAALLRGASQRLGRLVTHGRELGPEAWLELPPEEQYLVATGRVFFRGLAYDDVRRLQLDLETTGLDPDVDRVFMVAVRGPAGEHELLEIASDDDDAEAELLRRLSASVSGFDPDVIENHNLHGFDLPFLMRRSERPSRSALARALAAGALHDTRARLGIASEAREHIEGGHVHEVYLKDPARVRRYALDDVDEAAGVARLLGGAAFSLAQMAPRRYERLSDAGAATGVLDPLMVRAYFRAGVALPTHEHGDGTPHQGAALHLFAAGVARRIVKADVASLYPSLMRQYRIGPKRDTLGAFLTIIDRLLDKRLRAKAAARLATPGSAERFQLEALSTAIKLVINSGYGYLGAVGLTRFSDVYAANDITKRGRELLSFMCSELARRGVQLLEADTDGVYFSVPEDFTEADERRVVMEVAALLPPLVDLQFDGRYAAMLSHEPKNYVLKSYTGSLLLRGVAFRSSRSEPFGEAFLRRAVDRLLDGDLEGARAAYASTVRALRQRQLRTFEVCSRVRLTKTPEEYALVRGQRQALPYEALLVSGRQHWSIGERVYVYRRALGRAGLWRDRAADPELEPHQLEEGGDDDPRDYDVEHYVRQLRASFASRLARGVTAEDFEAIVADPDRPTLFSRSLSQAQPILSVLAASG